MIAPIVLPWKHSVNLLPPSFSCHPSFLFPFQKPAMESGYADCEPQQHYNYTPRAQISIAASRITQLFAVITSNRNNITTFIIRRYRRRDLTVTCTMSDENVGHNWCTLARLMYAGRYVYTSNPEPRHRALVAMHWASPGIMCHSLSLRRGNEIVQRPTDDELPIDIEFRETDAISTRRRCRHSIVVLCC